MCVSAVCRPQWKKKLGIISSENDTERKDMKPEDKHKGFHFLSFTKSQRRCHIRDKQGKEEMFLCRERTVSVAAEENELQETTETKSPVERKRT